MSTPVTAAATDFSNVTETAGTRITKLAYSMMYTRYAFAAELAAGKDVLEVACGHGQGLGLLARAARSLVAGDCTLSLVESARAHYGNRARIEVMDAECLPLADGSVDLVVLYEAIYYFANPGRFLAEARRVLRRGGTLLICSANREWSGFNPSPLSQKYLSADELRDFCKSGGFSGKVFAAFPEEPAGVLRKLVAVARTAAVSLHLIPHTMKGKELLKRLFYGGLVEVGPELLPQASPRDPLVPVGPGAVPSFKVLFAVATRTS